jgi:hypothetical protein
MGGTEQQAKEKEQKRRKIFSKEKKGEMAEWSKATDC